MYRGPQVFALMPLPENKVRRLSDDRCVSYKMFNLIKMNTGNHGSPYCMRLLPVRQLCDVFCCKL